MLQRIQKKNGLYPALVAIIGTLVNNKPNFNVIANLGILRQNRIMLSMRKGPYTNIRIMKTNPLSVHLPPDDIVIEPAWLGMHSGKHVDKSNIFPIQFGKLKNTPLISTVPIAIECKLIDIYDTSTHDIFIGEVEQVYADHSVLIDGEIDLSKVKPILYEPFKLKYWKIGEAFASSFEIDNKFKP